MTQRTITALYQQKSDAEQAKDQLKRAGVSGGDIDIHEQGDATASSSQAGGQEHGILGKLRGMFGDHEDTHTYAEGVRRGHYLLTAQVDEQTADQAIQILESSNAVDFDGATQGWRSEGWTGGAVATGAKATGAGDEQKIQLLEEQLRVGKREVERGGVRVRSYVVETPVQDQVSLREERVTIERRPVSERAGQAATFQDREIELTETAEEAVVAKEAIVREEIVIRKEVDERVETITETVRKTEVDIEDTTRRGASETAANPATAPRPL